MNTIDNAINVLLDAIHSSIILLVPQTFVHKFIFSSWFFKEFLNLVFKKCHAHKAYTITFNLKGNHSLSLYLSRYKYLSKYCHHR